MITYVKILVLLEFTHACYMDLCFFYINYAKPAMIIASDDDLVLAVTRISLLALLPGCTPLLCTTTQIPTLPKHPAIPNPIRRKPK